MEWPSSTHSWFKTLTMPDHNIVSYVPHSLREVRGLNSLTSSTNLCRENGGEGTE